MLLRFLTLGTVVLLGLTSCSGPSAEETVPQDVGLDIAVHEIKNGTYVNLKSGETVTESEYIAQKLEDKSDTGDDDFLRMVQSVGGFAKYSELLNTSTFKELKALHTKFGIGVSTKPPTSFSPKGELEAQRIAECVRYFPQTDRNKWHWMDQWKYSIYIDAYGRPRFANKQWELPTAPPDGGRDACQTTVGSWGVTGDVGGHLVAAMLNGYPRRANIVPQNGNLNNGNWKSVEYTVKRCVNRSPQTSIYASADYPNSSTIRPNQMIMALQTYRSRQYAAPFNNVYGGGPGTSGKMVAEDFARLFRPYCG